ncbi:MAG: hypothetical protein R3B47_03195 [Bacteroidia bacterium]
MSNTELYHRSYAHLTAGIRADLAGITPQWQQRYRGWFPGFSSMVYIALPEAAGRGGRNGQLREEGCCRRPGRGKGEEEIVNSLNHPGKREHQGF